MIPLVPIMHGVIDRRMLVNFRVRPEVAAALLPAPFRPKLARGWAMAGICLIRLRAIRPRGFPALLGLGSENAAHRIAVEWDENGATREGVYIPRRDTSSALQSWVGGRIFPGVHHRARYVVTETADEFHLKMEAEDGGGNIEVRAKLANWLEPASVFHSLAEASQFFERGAVGYSATGTPGCCDGLELHTSSWKVEPLKLLAVQSSYFDDRTKFPPGTIEFDHALLMRGIAHEWRTLPALHHPLKPS